MSGGCQGSATQRSQLTWQWAEREVVQNELLVSSTSTIPGGRSVHFLFPLRSCGISPLFSLLAALCRTRRLLRAEWNVRCEGPRPVSHGALSKTLGWWQFSTGVLLKVGWHCQNSFRCHPFPHPLVQGTGLLVTLPVYSWWRFEGRGSFSIFSRFWNFPAC